MGGGIEEDVLASRREACIFTEMWRIRETDLMKKTDYKTRKKNEMNYVVKRLAKNEGNTY